MVSYTETTARDAVFGLLRTAWLASSVTQDLTLLWEDSTRTQRDAEEQLQRAQFDDQGNPLSYARATMAVLSSSTESIGGRGNNRFLTEAILIVQVFTVPGDGYEHSDQIVEVLKGATRDVDVAELWFYDVFAQPLGRDKKWTRKDFQASIRYPEG